MDNIFKVFKASYISEIMWIILGGLIVKLFEALLNKWKRLIKKKKIKKKAIEFKYNNIVSLDHGDPHYTLNTLITKYQDKCLYVSIPTDIINCIRKYNDDFEYRESKSFNGQDTFDDLEIITGISNLKELIEKHRRIVGESFLSSVKSGKTIFNGEKFGVRSIFSDRKGLDEEARLIITFYNTDYFTHKVFRSIYKELSKNGHEISKVTKIAEVNKYYPFLTSFGINALLILEDYGVEEVILAERSKHVSNMNDDLWHISMNEGLSITDKEDNKVSLFRGLNRGLKEELGIREEHMESIISKSFNDLFINIDDFEIGLTSVIKTELDYNTVENLYKIAKDSELESNKIVKIKATRRDINKFIKENKATKACNYCLNMYLSRKENFL